MTENTLYYKSFVRRSLIPCNISRLFIYHTRNGTLQRLIAPWSGLTVISQSGGIKDGAVTHFRLSIGPLKITWIAKHFGYIQNQRFQDDMIKGPFKKWIHTHSFQAQGENNCVLEDEINYILKFSKLGSMLFQNRIQNYLNQLFLYRHRILINDTRIMKNLVEKNRNILISGSHGLIGSALIPFLSSVGNCRITRLIRPNINGKNHPVNTDDRLVYWDLEHKKLNLAELEGFDVIIHLTGENLFGRWSNSKKRVIIESRVKSTRFLCESMSKLSRPPNLLITASAIGYYGNRINEIMTEDSNPGSGFLSELCQEWEDVARNATKLGIRVINMRFGLVLSPLGGILQQLLRFSRLGMSLSIGNKSRIISWVSIEDVLASIFHSIINSSISGPVNIISPTPVTNLEFSRTLKRVLRTHLSLTIDEGMAKKIFGQFYDEVLSPSIFVIPKRLTSTGYKFFNSSLEDSLRFLLGRQIELGGSKLNTTL